MKWQIPAKTFLLGEYIALLGGSACVLTTQPCFTVELIHSEENEGIHPEAPASVFWKAARHEFYHLKFTDPYHNKGGLGASSAQFLGAYYASVFLQSKPVEENALRAAYDFYSFQNKGLKPSGYDIDAQMRDGCVFIDKANQKIESFAWPFEQLSFLLVHTGKKLATHQHLQNIALPKSIDLLYPIVEKAKWSFVQKKADYCIEAIQQYYSALKKMALVDPHTIALIENLQKNPAILAAKGCGAMGADIILLLMQTKDKESILNDLKNINLSIIASEKALFHRPAVVDYNFHEK